jgi:hypothetical protein
MISRGLDTGMLKMALAAADGSPPEEVQLRADFPAVACRASAEVCDAAAAVLAEPGRSRNVSSARAPLQFLITPFSPVHVGVEPC